MHSAKGPIKKIQKSKSDWEQRFSNSQPGKESHVENTDVPFRFNNKKPTNPERK